MFYDTIKGNIIVIMFHQSGICSLGDRGGGCLKCGGFPFVWHLQRGRISIDQNKIGQVEAERNNFAGSA